MSGLKKAMATYYKYSPLCWLTREKPDSPFTKLIFWHGEWCPFKKAWVDSCSEEDKRGETPKEPEDG